jgi:phosphohistidine phosphatase
MKTLYIVRHAKSSWDHPELADHERPVLEIGIVRTKKVADYLLDQKTHLDLIYSSHAVRARETANIIAQALNYPVDQIQILTTIYEGNVDSLLNHLPGLSDEITSLMMVGHNPTFTSFANYFLDKPIDWLPTSGIVCLEFKTDKWENIFHAKKRTKFVISPKLIKEGKGRK